MASGVSVDPQVLSIFNDVKLNKNIFFVLYKLSDDKKVIVFEKKHEKPADVDYSEENIKQYWTEFVQALPEKNCRYAIYDFGYLLPDGSRRDKILFVCWCPDVANIKDKMLYASSKDALKKAFVGVFTELQANDKGDLDFNTIREKLNRKTGA